MPLLSMFASLRRHRVPALMLVLEVTLACAVLSNVLFMLRQRLADIHTPNHMAEKRLAVLTVYNRSTATSVDTVAREISALKGVAGVTSVAQAGSMPLTGDAWEGGVRADPARQHWHNASVYMLGAGGIETLGLKLRQGRAFQANDYAQGSFDSEMTPTSPVVMLSQSLAEHLWPGQPAVGKILYDAAGQHTVIGVVDDVLAPTLAVNGPNGRWNTTFYPLRPSTDVNYYLLDTDPSQLDRVQREAHQRLQRIDPEALIADTCFARIRKDYFATDRSMAWMLALVCVVMLAATALGVVGLTSFWVGQRRVQIGIRRALGARHRDILVYFQSENLLLSLAGGLMGALAGYGLNLYLMRAYEFGHLPFAYLWLGALALLLLGQLAALGPAWRASRISPVVAMRG